MHRTSPDGFLDNICRTMHHFIPRHNCCNSMRFWHTCGVGNVADCLEVICLLLMSARGSWTLLLGGMLSSLTTLLSHLPMPPEARAVCRTFPPMVAALALWPRCSSSITAGHANAEIGTCSRCHRHRRPSPYPTKLTPMLPRPDMGRQ